MALLGALAASVDFLAKSGAIPPGTMAAFPGASPGAGWLPCDGSEIPAGLPLLEAELATRYGTGANGRSRVPNCVNRLVKGRKVGTNSVGATGGSLGHTHGRGSLAFGSHQHGVGNLRAPAHNHPHSLWIPDHLHGLAQRIANDFRSSDADYTFGNWHETLGSSNNGLVGSGPLEAGVIGLGGAMPNDGGAALSSGSTAAGDPPFRASDIYIRTDT